MTPQQLENLKAAAPAAKQAAAKLGLHPSFPLLALSQWVFESQWGLHAPGFNFMGLKALPSAPEDERQLLHTQEYFTDAQLKAFLATDKARTATPHPDPQGKIIQDAHGRTLYDVQDWFVKFPTLEACFEKHGQLISTGAPYQMAYLHFKQTGNVFQLAQDIAPHYSTDAQYAHKLVGMMRSDILTVALAHA